MVAFAEFSCGVGCGVIFVGSPCSFVILAEYPTKTRSEMYKMYLPENPEKHEKQWCLKKWSFSVS